MLSAFQSGFFLGAGLIIAIGAQNAFILRQGLLRDHVFVLCFICALSDALLILIGVAGLGAIIEQSQLLLGTIRYAGAAFLFWYATLALRRAFNPQAMSVEKGGRAGLGKAIATVLALTFLNPHVYLDTVLLVGGLSTRFEGDARLAYTAGAMLASFVWFFSLGYGARLLTPIFAKPRAWQVLDVLIAIVMAAIGLSLVVGS